uniref:Ig-like domain-containing protein n=1 Tax=Terrapene triunguis TaxID=2587831 RepID=A0A674JER3_9SAUR
MASSLQGNTLKQWACEEEAKHPKLVLYFQREVAADSCAVILTELLGFCLCVSGFHIIQTIFGCDLRGRQHHSGETMTWVAADIGAQITKRRWDAEVDDNQGWNLYLEEECILWLRSALEYGKETLQRKVRPTARVSDRSSHDGLTTLSCKVSGFYPRDITVTWLKNGESRQQETYSEGILPSGDGTYQTWVTMEIDPKIKAHYSCRMEHESLLEPLSVFWGKAFLCLSVFLRCLMLGATCLCNDAGREGMTLECSEEAD